MNAADALWKPPLVMQCVDDGVAGRRHPLHLISSYV